MIDFSSDKHVVVLIDADNAQLNYMAKVLDIAQYYGQLRACRAYGDWTHPPLSSQHEQIDALEITCIQVNRIGKNATDHRLLIEAGELLSFNFFEKEVDVFIIVSGDGDFASACQLIQERGKHVIGVGNRNQTSPDLTESCNKFYYLEDLDQELKALKKHYPIPPSEVRTFFNYLFFAYRELANVDNNGWIAYNEDWVSYSQIGAKLRERHPDFESKFGKYKLSELLKSFDQYFETREQMIRRIDRNPNFTRFDLMLNAYLQTRQPDGTSHLGTLRKKLRELDSNYDKRFGSKKLSAWLADYPDDFRLRDNYVIHRVGWGR